MLREDRRQLASIAQKQLANISAKPKPFNGKVRLMFSERVVLFTQRGKSRSRGFVRVDGKTISGILFDATTAMPTFMAIGKNRNYRTSKVAA